MVALGFEACSPNRFEFPLCKSHISEAPGAGPHLLFSRSTLQPQQRRKAVRTQKNQRAGRGGGGFVLIMAGYERQAETDGPKKNKTTKQKKSKHQQPKNKTTKPNNPNTKPRVSGHQPYRLAYSHRKSGARGRHGHEVHSWAIGFDFTKPSLGAAQMRWWNCDARGKPPAWLAASSLSATKAQSFRNPFHSFSAYYACCGEILGFLWGTERDSNKMRINEALVDKGRCCALPRLWLDQELCHL